MGEGNKLTLEDIGSFLEKLAEKSQSVYWLSSPDFKKIQYISPAYDKIWGRDRNILYKEPELWITYLHPDDVEGYNPIHAMAERVAQEGAMARYQENYRIVRPDGEVRWIIDQGFPIYNSDGQCCGVTGVAVDITKDKLIAEELRKEKEKAEIANKSKTEFLENMRHDIRTPLSGIIGFAELLKSEISDPKLKEYASNLAASGYALTDLLNEVLEVIKVSSGEIPILKKKFNLHKKLNEILLLNQAKALHKKIDLSIDYDPTIPNYLFGDSARINRIVLELVANALNFTHKGYVKLSARLAKNSDDNVIIKIIVDDTGIGIPPEKQQDIYLQFKRLTPSYEGIYKGHGLGLSIAKQLIDDLNGEIYVESQLGAGSKFIFIVKLKKALLDEEIGSEDLIPLFTGNQFVPPIEFKVDPTTEETETSYKSRILVVEDSPIAAQVVTNMLSHMNCKVDLAEQGKTAVDMAEHQQYDLIFMDIGLPDIDGYETTKRIRLNELKKSHVPIIALTAHASEENKKYCIEIGMNAVLTKPLPQEKAEDILNSFIPYRREKLKSKETPDAIAETTPYQALAIFDFEELKTLSGHNEKVAIEVATFFLEGLPQELREIQAAYAQKDWSSVQSLTHKFKGGVSYCGAPRLKEACAQLENAIRAGESELFEKLYDALLSDIALTEREIRVTLTKK